MENLYNLMMEITTVNATTTLKKMMTEIALKVMIKL